MSDILLIGGGVMGLMSAYYLRRAGFTVTLLEQNQQCGQQSSWAGGGICSPLYPWRHQANVSALLTQSQMLYPDLVAELQHLTQMDCELQRSGLLIIDSKETDYASQWAAQYHIPLEKITAETLTQHYSYLGIHADALWLPDVMQIRNPRLLQALQRALLQDKGVTLVTNQSVVDWKTQNQRVIAAITQQGQHFDADKIVVTAGAWSGQLLQTLQVACAVEPVKGQMLLFQATPALLRHIVLFQNHYLIPRQDGYILAGSTLENAGFDARPTRDAFEQLYAASIALLPALAGANVAAHWAGLRPGGVSEPLIGCVDGWENLYLNTGHFRMGLALAPASAQKLANIILH